MFAIRKIGSKGRKYTVDGMGKIKLADVEDIIDDEDEEDDEDWKEHDDDDRFEPLEYTSDDDGGECDSDTEMADVDDAEKGVSEEESSRSFWLRGLLEDDNARDKLCADDSSLPAWYRGFPAHVQFKEQDGLEDDMFGLFYNGRDDAIEYGTDGSFGESDDRTDSARANPRLRGKLGYHEKDIRDVEHIAGPKCQNICGYSGHEISVEEMRGCQVLQCLARKPKGWAFEPADDDEDFEKDGDFFLTGLSDFAPSLDIGSPRATPPRHGCRRHNAVNTIWDMDALEGYTMPFHPSCLEVFKRASILKHGTIDIHGLTSWWTKDAQDYDNFVRHPHDSAVKKCADSEWMHCRNTAYLAANPLYVPKLRDIFSIAINTAPGFSTRDGAFSVPDIATTEQGDVDLFSRLPAELRFRILTDLGSKDIAALRLSSRTFRQLPISYFQKIIQREMPWLWEAWPTMNKPNQPSYAFWATVTGIEAERKLQKGPNAIAALNDYVDIVSKEMPEIASQLQEVLPSRIQDAIDAQKLELEEDDDRKPFFLPPDKTNYFELYTLLTRHWADLKGLQNRRRIWRACEEILEQIEQMKQGEIDQ